MKHILKSLKKNNSYECFMIESEIEKIFGWNLDLDDDDTLFLVSINKVRDNYFFSIDDLKTDTTYANEQIKVERHATEEWNSFARKIDQLRFPGWFCC